jgi:hypothetical protein
MFNVGGHLQIVSNHHLIDISQSPFGPASNYPVVSGLGCNENYIEFSYSYEFSACVKYKILNSDNEVVYEIEGFFRYGGGSISLNNILQEGDDYRIEATLFCCDNDGVIDESYSETFIGNFNFQPNALETGDVDFLWIGSAGTEQINQDNDLLNNTHPIDQEIMQLGELTCGAYLSEDLTTNNLSRIRYKLEKLEFCDEIASGEVLYEYDEFVTDLFAVNPGYIPLVINFNAVTNGYFFNSNDYVKGETCFRYTVVASYSGTPNSDSECFSRSNSAIFQIANNCPFCLTVNEVTPEIAAKVGLNSLELNTSDIFNVGNIELAVLPNPVQDILYIQGGDKIKNVMILSSSAKVMYSGGRMNVINIEDFPTGLYFVKISSFNGTIETHKIIKE